MPVVNSNRPDVPPGFRRRPIRDIRPGMVAPFNGRWAEVTKVFHGRNNMGVEARGDGFTIVWGVDEDDELEVEDEQDELDSDLEDENEPEQ